MSSFGLPEHLRHVAYTLRDTSEKTKLPLPDISSELLLASEDLTLNLPALLGNHKP